MTIGIGGMDMGFVDITITCLFLGLIEPQGAPCKWTYNDHGHDAAFADVSERGHSIRAPVGDRWIEPVVPERRRRRCIRTPWGCVPSRRNSSSLTRHLPLKAVVLNLFTGAATAGLLVAAHSGPTTRAEGGLDVQIVVLLARVRELRRSGLSTSEAACLAMDRTWRTISAGAAIICVTFAGMSFGDVIAIRQLGLGLIIVVILDVTVVRAILVPVMLTLLGRANWWAPAPLARLRRRLGADTWHGTDPATSPEAVTGEAKVLARR